MKKAIIKIELLPEASSQTNRELESEITKELSENLMMMIPYAKVLESVKVVSDKHG